ncbi:MAG TPA: hypothetical protein VHZ25_11340 [Acidobacteriaceae bacterium]|jgi:hypothetical protein|nr:hypothetical protein [Acidobacteriaceae bacterium]
MSKIRLSFVANVPYGNVSAAGALVLDTTTQKFSHVSVVCTGGHHVAPHVWYAEFAGPGSPYPAGMPTIVNIGDQNNGITVQMNYHDHGNTTPPIPLNGGFVEGVPFDFLKVPAGNGGTGWIVVTPA